MLSIVAGKTIETLIKQLVPNDRSHYLKSAWIENGKYPITLNNTMKITLGILISK